MRDSQLNYKRIFIVASLIVVIPLILWQSYNIGYTNGVRDETTKRMLETIEQIKQVQDDISEAVKENKEVSSRTDERTIENTIDSSDTTELDT
jgi:hypothetical protein